MTARVPLGRCLLGIVLALCAWHLARWPVAAGDADVWYHLNTGRWLWAHRALPPDSGFVSFITPPRPFVDYSWLFQAILYPLCAAGGYPALIALRAVLFLALLAVLARYAARSGADASRTAALTALYAAVLILRFKLVRPQMASELLLACVLYLLEFEPPGSSWLLPAAAVVWCNVHGIYWPVLELAVGAYALELAERRLRPTWGQVAACAATLATPYGWRLLPVPFIPLGGAARYLGELMPVRAADFFSVGVRGAALTHQGWSLLLLAAAAAGAFQTWRRGRIRLAHAVLAAGALALLPRGTRFMYDAALLLLPLVVRAPLPERPPRAAWLAAAAAAAALAFSLSDWFGARPAWPVSGERLPGGVAAFLAAYGGGGRVLDHPNGGGYLEWALPASYRVYMDMRVPHLFSAEDFLEARQAFLDPAALGRLLSRYDPPFVSAPLSDPAFPGVIGRYPDLVPVFFDDAEVLYASRRQRSELVRAWALDWIDPFALANEGRAPGGAAARAGLARMIAVDPRCLTTRQLAAQLALASGDRAAAAEQARAILRDFPEYPVGRMLVTEAERLSPRGG